MAGGSSSGSDGAIDGINVVPLVDIMLVLVIILMVTAEFTKYKTVKVSLPKAKAAAMDKEPQKVNVTVKENGDVFVNKQKFPNPRNNPAPLRGVLAQLKKDKPRLSIILHATPKTDYGMVTSVVDEIRTQKIENLGLAVDKLGSK